MHLHRKGRQRFSDTLGADALNVGGVGTPSVATLVEGESAKLLEVVGGGRLQARLANMGLRAGKTITKCGALPGRGPVTVEVDGCKIALGHGIACKVLVERAEANQNDTD